MKILLLTFYYPPDLSAGSYRAAAIAEAIGRADSRVTVDVLTTQPNRYASYDGGDCSRQKPLPGGGQITRLGVTTHASGLADQALAFAVFAARAIGAVRGRRYDLVVATSSRLFTGYLGSIIAKICGARFYLDLRDLFADVMPDLFPEHRMIKAIVPLLLRMERATVERADRVNLVSEGFLPRCRQLYPQRQFSIFGNGIDEEFLGVDYSASDTPAERVVLYAGNVGAGQAIERVLPEAARLLQGEFQFRVVGGGGRFEALRRRIESDGLRNVHLDPPASREDLKEAYRQADALLLHLNDAETMRLVLPSKVFEYAATGKPILAGVSGFAKSFIEREVANAAVFDPCKPHALAAALRTLDWSPVDRRAFVERYSRRGIMSAMAADILRTTGIGDP